MSDWSSDVCSSDLDGALVRARVGAHPEVLQHGQLREELAALGDVRDPPARDRLDGQPVDQLPAEAHRPARPPPVRRSEEGVEGKSVSVRVDRGGHRIIKNKKKINKTTNK